PDALAAYAKLAGPAIAAAGGRFLARGNAAKAYEAGGAQRVVVIEFDSVEKAVAAYDSEGYQAALKGFGKAADRDFRIVEGLAQAAHKGRSRNGAHRYEHLQLRLEGARLPAQGRGRQGLYPRRRARAEGHAGGLHLQPLPLRAGRHPPPGGGGERAEGDRHRHDRDHAERHAIVS